ncbi:MAG: hypothetical protein HOL66_11920 [Rhodospirillaceae bacterium]|jgi:hypothetical protein|nr:hypothetical protein [Rhodospirillaceae bacterium]MBT5244938.1 hypothetical protein [Rhodospirillaceae bacterium]MBT5562671.1 hypothetical protein [Rhodospirillaceae bacterium]MBT6243019.1 hypothetical protein [Rhodospirillaceae bacterium]MBT7136866.1 hypothetical protein [Rhodospirillaceae bacterium]
MRLQIELADEMVEPLYALKDTCALKTNKDLFDNAVTLLEWAVGEVQKGNIIASVNEAEDRMVELQMPVLQAAKRNATNEVIFETPDISHFDNMIDDRNVATDQNEALATMTPAIPEEIEG